MSDPIQEAIDNLPKLPELQPTEIRVIVKGGNVQQVLKGVNVPPTIVVNVCNYDVDGLNPDEIKARCFINSNGDHCVFGEER